MNFVLRILREKIADRRNQILQWEAQLKRGGDAVSEANWLGYIGRCREEMRECEDAIKAVELFYEMYSKRTKGLNPSETSFGEYLEKWVSIKV